MTDEANNTPVLGLGEYLRTERERKTIALEQVASATKINIKLLQALESDNYDALPAKPFVRGFVASYARFIGIDPRELMTRFELFLDEKTSKKFKRPENQPHIFVEKEGQSDNSKTTLTIVMVGFLVIFVVAFAILKPSFKHGRGRHKKAAEETAAITPAPETLNPTAVASTPPEANLVAVNPTVVVTPQPKATPVAKPTPTPTPIVTPTPTPTPTPKPTVVAKAPEHSPTPAATPVVLGKIPPLAEKDVRHRLIVRAVDDAWVKYQSDDRPLQQFTLRKEKKIFIRAKDSLRFTTAKPKAIEISFDNRDFKPFGSAARVIVLPKDLEANYKENPFVPPNPAYLSTPNP